MSVYFYSSSLMFVYFVSKGTSYFACLNNCSDNLPPYITFRVGKLGMATGVTLHVNRFLIYNCTASSSLFRLNIPPCDRVKMHNFGGVSHYNNLISINDDTWVQIDYDGVDCKDILSYRIVDCVQVHGGYLH